MSVHDITAGLRDFAEWATDPRPRIGWGLPFFDSRTNGGLARSEICMVQAFSSVGKTSLGLNIIRNNADVPAMIFSLEMSWRMVVSRLTAMETGKSTTQLEGEVRAAGGLTPEFQRVVDKYSKLVCDDTPEITLKEASASFERATEMLGERPRLVLFDYLELIGGGGMMEQSQAVDKASRKVRNWCRKHDCAVVLLHQVGKGEGGDQPLDLGSGRYGGFAPMDYVVGAYAPRLRKGITQQEFDACKEEVYLQLLKSRAGDANPAGVRHRLDSRTLTLTPWTEVPLTPFFAQQGRLA